MMSVRTASGRTLLALTLATAALGGCKKTPEGQVVATVNGDEITRRDLASEFSASGGKNTDDLTAVQPTLIQNIVTRKLLVQEAERTNLDKNPQYLAASQRGQEALLAQMLAQSWSAKIKPATPQQLTAFIAANPLIFGERKILLCDTLTTANNSVTQAQLAKLTNNDEIARWLTANKKPFQRAQKQIDTMALPQELARQLVAKIGSGPVAINSGAAYTVIAVLAARDAPVPQNQWTNVAKAALLQREQGEAAEAQVKRLRSSADISYLPGFAPPAPTK